MIKCLAPWWLFLKFIYLKDGSRLKCLVLLDHNEYNTEASLRVVFFFSHAAHWFLLLAFFANVKIFFLPLLEERQKFWGLTRNKRLWLYFNEGCSDLAPALQTHFINSLHFIYRTKTLSGSSGTFSGLTYDIFLCALFFFFIVHSILLLLWLSLVLSRHVR